MRRQYMIIKWDEKSQTSPLLRTTDKALFRRGMAACKKQWNLTNKNARIIVREDMTIFSFAATLSSYISWADIAYFNRPLEVRKPFGSQQPGMW